MTSKKSLADVKQLTNIVKKYVGLNDFGDDLTFSKYIVRILETLDHKHTLSYKKVVYKFLASYLRNRLLFRA